MCLFAFSLMASYYVLRPVRDAMSSDWSDAELSWLWTLNFFISAAAVMLYGWIASRTTLKKLVPAVYLLMAREHTRQAEPRPDAVEVTP